MSKSRQSLNNDLTAPGLMVQSILALPYAIVVSKLKVLKQKASSCQGHHCCLFLLRFHLRSLSSLIFTALAASKWKPMLPCFVEWTLLQRDKTVGFPGRTQNSWRTKRTGTLVSVSRFESAFEKTTFCCWLWQTFLFMGSLAKQWASNPSASPTKIQFSKAINNAFSVF